MMAEESKQFPASDYKLEQLRRAGDIPYSVLFTSAGALLGGALAFAFLISQAPSVLSDAVRRALLMGELTTGRVQQAEFIGNLALASLSLLPAAAAIVGLVALLLGLLQTRFFLSFRQLIPSPGRAFRFQPVRIFSGLSWGLRRSVLVLATVFLIFTLIRSVIIPERMPVLSERSPLTVVYSSAAPGVDLGTRDTVGVRDPAVVPRIARSLARQAGAILTVLLFFALVVGGISRIVAGVAYRRRHQMSRSEIEAEMREMEMRPELKRGVRDQRSET